MDKFTTICLGLALCFGLSSCSLLVEDTYYAVTPHPVAPVSEGSGVITIENYRELVNAILQFVTEHAETGQIRLTNYDRDLAWEHLEEASDEILHHTALGSYGVEDINWETNTILSYLEAEITITYGKDQEEFESITPVSGTSAITKEVTNAIHLFEEEVVLLNTWSSNNRSQISSLLQTAIHDSVDSLVEIPQIQVNFYPKEGAWRILELQFLYATKKELLLQQQEQVVEELSALSASLWSMESQDMYQNIISRVKSRDIKEGEGNTPYQLLLQGQSNNQGYALTFHAICQDVMMDSTVVQGTYQGKNHYWNQITLEEGQIQHMDLSHPLPEEGQFPYYSDEEWTAMGYDWDKNLYPQALPLPLEEEEIPSVSNTDD